MTPVTCPTCRTARVVNGVWFHRCATYIERSHLCRRFVAPEFVIVPDMVTVASIKEQRA